MTEFARSWESGGVRKHFRLRLWWGGSPLRPLWRWLTGRAPWWRTFASAANFRMRTRAGDGMCYCPTGSTTEVRLECFGVGLWFWLTRDWTRRPCWCDAVLWKMFAGHEDDIEAAGGMAALEARFPDIKDVPWHGGRVAC